MIEKALNQNSKRFEGVCVGKQIFGTYVHGLFDQASFRKRFFDLLRQKKGLPAPEEEVTVSWEEIREEELARISKVLEENLDPKFLDCLLAGQ